MDAQLLDITGWPPSELDAVDRNRVVLLLLYKNVVQIVQTGKGSYLTGD